MQIKDAACRSGLPEEEALDRRLAWARKSAGGLCKMGSWPIIVKRRF